MQRIIGGEVTHAGIGRGRIDKAGDSPMPLDKLARQYAGGPPGEVKGVGQERRKHQRQEARERHAVDGVPKISMSLRISRREVKRASAFHPTLGGLYEKGA